ncbi:MAG: PAS domain S-box protein, partial [Dehalococcoidales bacterium]|nr:PAS domain S-box protein [Dehalococcoidales bacterium]
MLRFIRDRYVWYMAIIIGIVTIFTYIVEPNLFGKIFEDSEWHSISVAIRNFLFLGIVAVSTWKFGLRRGLVICLAIGLIPLPHIITETLVEEYHPGVLAEYMVFIPVGIVISWLIGSRKKADETIKLQAELLDKELDSVYLTDFEGNLIYVNKAAWVTHGYTREELLNMTLKNLDGTESAKLIAPRLKEIFEKGEVTFEVSHFHKNGSLIPLEIHASKIVVSGKQMVLSVAHDITGRRKAQEQLMAQDRLASIGQLVSGVAHELNNPLTSVIGFSELLL